MMIVDDVDKVVKSGGKYQSSGASRSEERGEIKQCCNVILCYGVDGDDGELGDNDDHDGHLVDNGGDIEDDDGLRERTKGRQRARQADEP